MLRMAQFTAAVVLVGGLFTGIHPPTLKAQPSSEGKKMSVLAVQLTINDYSTWRPAFDRAQSLRDKAGLRNTRVYRDADNAKEVLVWSETDDLAKAREGVTGPDIRKAMQDSGVIGPPRVHAIP
jgi:hypothetical protein